jgi:hypothetical protein
MFCLWWSLWVFILGEMGRLVLITRICSERYDKLVFILGEVGRLVLITRICSERYDNPSYNKVL